MRKFTNDESESESKDEEWNLEVYSSDEEDAVPKKKQKMSEPETLLRNKMSSKISKNKSAMSPKKASASNLRSIKTY